MRLPKLFPVLLAAALAFPAASATWFTQGTYEPDTLCDDATGCVVPGQTTQVAGGYMWITPPDDPAMGLRVYFNGYTTFNSVGVNPNNEVLGSRHIPAGANSFYAWLGVWKDCNKDGYIGAAQGAMDVYSASLGVDTTLCGDGSVFNRGGWVYEFQWIGNGAFIGGDPNYPSRDDQRWINDTASRVWADWDLPGYVNLASSCPITPPAAGTTAGTGGALAYLDCFSSRRVARGINTADGAAGTGLGFEDPAAPQRSNSPLNQHLPVTLFGDPNGDDEDRSRCSWETGLFEFNSQEGRDCTYDPMQHYDPDNDRRAFDVWDCSQPEGTPVADPTGGELEEDGVFFTLPAPSVFVASDPTHASFYDGLNATERGTYGAQGFLLGPGGAGGILQSTPIGSGNRDGGDRTCAKDQGGAAWFVVFPGVESNRGVSDTGTGRGRSTTDTPMNFLLAGTVVRGRQVGNVVVTHPADDSTIVANDFDSDLKNATGSDTGDMLNETLGEGYEAPGVFSVVASRPGWFGTGGWANLGPTIERSTLQPESGIYVTYYATLGAATFNTGAKTPKANVASFYGDEWCNGSYVGDANPDGFNCDRATWWANADSPESPPLANGIDVTTRPGDPYHARDIDCFDGSVFRGSTVRVSLVDLSANGPCADSAN